MAGNQVAAGEERGMMANSEWVESWALGNTGFHFDKHDPYLDEHEEEIFGDEPKNVFVPLCGKSKDMIWMHGRGHTVVGVEIAEQPIRELFQEHDIPHQVLEVAGVGKLYKSNDERLLLYAADIFDISESLVGKFNVIWDMKSIVAINVADRIKYRDLLLSVLYRDGVYYVGALEFDSSVWAGPPHTMDRKAIEDLFPECLVELIDEMNVTGRTLSTLKSEEKMVEFNDAGLALKSSPYLYARTYKMKFK
ncbi:probable thiopurine S-methyltransferase [Mya arenaria]|uniref:probable thiopurine S-methyltransferase n=1 Tax=Mya arenaria TaxID=6604 RepID=UPI0022E7BFB3|nr:probable thiopurine S-methyltransferase [Mya arenaria]